jgi:phage terminase large subunit-like protein
VKTARPTKVRKIPLNIIDFVTKMNLGEPVGPSLGHRTFLKAFYGLALNAEELDFYFKATGRTNYLLCEQKEVTAIVGRRGGKTTLASQIAIYEAVRYRKLPRGGRAFVLVVAPILTQAQIAFDYIREGFYGSPELKRLIDKERSNEIRLRNGITIACYPCSYIAVRGISVVCAICDELAFWSHEETSANPENEVMAALRPAMATFPNAKLIKISTPYRKEGIL